MRVTVIKWCSAGADGIAGTLAADGISCIQHSGNISLNGHLAGGDRPGQAVHMQPNPKRLVGLLVLGFQRVFRLCPRHAANMHAIHINALNKRIAGQKSGLLPKQGISLIQRRSIKPQQTQRHERQHRCQHPQRSMLRFSRRNVICPLRHSLRRHRFPDFGLGLIDLIRIWSVVLCYPPESGRFILCGEPRPQCSLFVLIFFWHPVFPFSVQTNLILLHSNRNKLICQSAGQQNTPFFLERREQLVL